ncbi:MAG: phosphoglucomutase/phosphomannomutase family protein, partial [Saprospiraceae bacterium]|nr:phosphoglucomutase/phosphomannomutase family protein [Saprospiraceae bacterium]
MNKPAQIKFGTDGWRAIIAEDYTLENLRRVCMGTVLWMKKNELKSALIGHDCRFGGRLFLEESARVFA